MRQRERDKVVGRKFNTQWVLLRYIRINQQPHTVRCSKLVRGQLRSRLTKCRLARIATSSRVSSLESRQQEVSTVAETIGKSWQSEFIPLLLSESANDSVVMSTTTEAQSDNLFRSTLEDAGSTLVICHLAKYSRISNYCIIE